MLSISLSSLGPFFSAIMPAFTQLLPPHCWQLSCTSQLGHFESKYASPDNMKGNWTVNAAKGEEPSRKL
jgi:hypothetical protein